MPSLSYNRKKTQSINCLASLSYLLHSKRAENAFKTICGQEEKVLFIFFDFFFFIFVLVFTFSFSFSCYRFLYGSTLLRKLSLNSWS